MTMLLFVIQFSACSKADDSSIQPAKPTETKDRTYRTLDGQSVIALVSSDELEVRQNGENIVCKYTEKDKKLRVVMSESGTTKAKYYDITPQGLVGEQGEVLYEPATHKKIKADTAELSGLMKKALETGDDAEIKAHYRKGGPPEALFELALQSVITNADMREAFHQARSRSMVNACINNLRQIDGATDQYRLDHNNKSPTSISDLVPTYISKTPICQSGGTYEIALPGKAPKCSFGGAHVLPP